MLFTYVIKFVFGKGKIILNKIVVKVTDRTDSVQETVLRQHPLGTESRAVSMHQEPLGEIK